MNSPKQNEKKTVTVKDASETEVSFVPFGATDPIRLSISMIRTFIAVPAKNGVLPSPRDCLKFLMLCKGKRANPFEGDCYMLGYNDGDGATYSIVCGIEMFLKRAEQCNDYDGCEYGVIVSGGEIGTIERQGAIVYDNEKLLGGWSKAYRKNHRLPHYKAVKFSTYDTGKSRWVKDPGGQIAKVALSQCLRELFPTPLGGLYTQEEMDRVTELGNGTLTAVEPIPMPEELPRAELPDPVSDEGRRLSAELDREAEQQEELPFKK